MNIIVELVVDLKPSPLVLDPGSMEAPLWLK